MNKNKYPASSFKADMKNQIQYSEFNLYKELFKEDFIKEAVFKATAGESFKTLDFVEDSVTLIF